MSRESLVQVTNQERAELTGRLALLYEWIAGQDRVQIHALVERALKEGKVYGKRPDNHIEWDVRQLVKAGAVRVVPERRAIPANRLVAIHIHGNRYGLYVPEGHVLPRATAADSFSLADDRRQFQPKGRAERKRYSRLTEAA